MERLVLKFGFLKKLLTNNLKILKTYFSIKILYIYKYIMQIFQPKSSKFKKTRKGKLYQFDFKNNVLKYGNIGIKSIESGLINSYQLESIITSLKRKVKKKAKIWIRFFPFIPITSKPLESRMGKGKGNLKYWSLKVACGSILIELSYKQSMKSFIIRSLKELKHKFPVKTQITEI